ncbi:MAG: 3-isopropylmalate dehydratase small subunit [Deltaproteobacteria bacterium]|nr:3-isopropylmalate dehydratase small subunit [Deltaproteobacteria bacterium]MBW2340563.1 3-isopropylmalate dehydratase small subunit [Deltaproteobacteria bacterium]
MRLQGKAWKFGDNVNTDLIIPARYLNSSDKDELARHCFADVRPGFVEMISPGDIIVAGNNFGSGSSREHAPLAIKGAGISVLVAQSFARIFYRNAFNIGLPIMESKEAAQSIDEGSLVSVDLATGEIVNMNTGQQFFAKPVPRFMREIVDAGGLVEYVRKKGLTGLGAS